MHAPIRSIFQAGAVASMLVIFATGCDDSSVNAPESISADTPEQHKPSVAGAPQGVQAVPSTRTVEQTIDALEQALEPEQSKVLARIDHQANARTVDIEIPPTLLLLIAFPTLDLSLMQMNQQVALDLPHKMLAYEDPQGSIKLVFQGADYLQQRYGLDDSDSISQLRSRLAGLAETSGGSAVGPHEEGTREVEKGEGILVLESANDFETTYQKLKQAIEANDALNLVADFDHAADAAAAGASLPPTRLLVLGNPKVGSPMIEARQSIALELPQKMLVYQDGAGKVYIGYNDPEYISRRHSMLEPGQASADDQVEALASVLAGLANTAASEEATTGK